MFAILAGCAPQNRVDIPNPPGITRSADDRHIAWAQSTTGGKVGVAVDGKLDAGEYDKIDKIVMSPDGRGYAYTAANGEGWFITRDGVEGPGWGSIVLGDKAYSPDGKTYVCAAQKNQKWYLLVNGPAYDRLYKPAFRDSGMEYLAVKNDGGWLVRIQQPYPAEGAAGTAQVTETKLSPVPKVIADATECVPCKKQRQLLQGIEGE